MSITREELLNHKATLEKELEETIGKANALGGAIQECDYWLSKLTEPAEEKQD